MGLGLVLMWERNGAHACAGDGGNTGGEGPAGPRHGAVVCCPATYTAGPGLTLGLTHIRPLASDSSTRSAAVKVHPSMHAATVPHAYAPGLWTSTPSHSAMSTSEAACAVPLRTRSTWPRWGHGFSGIRGGSATGSGESGSAACGRVHANVAEEGGRGAAGRLRGGSDHIPRTDQALVLAAVGVDQVGSPGSFEAPVLRHIELG